MQSRRTHGVNGVSFSTVRLVVSFSFPYLKCIHGGTQTHKNGVSKPVRVMLGVADVEKATRKFKVNKWIGG